MISKTIETAHHSNWDLMDSEMTTGEPTREKSWHSKYG